MDDSIYDPPAGYALRKNGTCGADQETCGNPWLDWYNCCPKGTHCDEHNTCCPKKAGCEQWLVADPHCANNKTWDLYETEPGGNFFCCLSTSSAYLAGGLESNGTATTGIACADGIPDGAKDDALVPVARGTAYQSSTNKGAIAGGVVGGCAGLALIIALVWFLMRRRRQQARATDPLTSSDPSTPAQDKKGVYGFELDNNAVRPELQGNSNTMAHELPPDTVPQELPASPVR